MFSLLRLKTLEMIQLFGECDLLRKLDDLSMRGFGLGPKVEEA